MPWTPAPNERLEAETLEDRISLKAQKDDPVRYTCCPGYLSHPLAIL